MDKNKKGNIIRTAKTLEETLDPEGNLHTDLTLSATVLLLRDLYRDGWKPTNKDSNKQPYMIDRGPVSLSLIARPYYGYTMNPLSFQDKETAEDFLKNTESLIKKYLDTL